jgi:pimeloyl-ACP methyl ester carboxylesterase
VKTPTLVIHGDLDPLVPYPNGQYIASQIPGATLSTYVGVGHLPPIEASERFNREVEDFLDGSG